MLNEFVLEKAGNVEKPNVFTPEQSVKPEMNYLSAARKKNDSEELKLDFAKRPKEYRKTVRNELKLERDTRITELCTAIEVDEKSFWKLIKRKRSSNRPGGEGGVWSP